ncbi:glycosyltransferase family 2 protein [Epilithonimonas sp.]|uniref:glycosyltransferase family 2 protein n=1 Tax=Epilithonimonas sp. TaxID=2894511 RepID=UPI0028B167B3|nr:glycosyltransferase family 2 protein [Epilithonimonas sp.]
MKVFAIVVIYNGMQRNWIQKCFDSILTSSIPVDIIAIDNGSTDGSIDFIKENYPQVDFTVSEKNLGFGKANNIGLRKALDKGGDYFFLLNQDAWVDPNTIAELVKQATKNSEYGVISPMHLNGKGDAIDYNVAEYYLKPSRCPQLVSDLYLKKEINKLYEIEFINAAAWLISKECLKRVGGFSPTFYHYGEDENYANRLHFFKLKMGIYPFVSIYHDRFEREKSFYDSKNQIEERRILIKFSNPINNLDAEVTIRKLKVQKVKNFIKFNFSKIADLEFLKLHKIAIINNLRISKETKDYKFL